MTGVQTCALPILDRLSLTRHFPMEDANHDPQPTRERYTSSLAGLLMLPSQHHILFKKHPPTNPQLTPSKVLGQERFHIPLAWLARNIAWLVKLTRCSVLKDVGETTTLACKSTNSQPTTLHHPHHESLLFSVFDFII